MSNAYVKNVTLNMNEIESPNPFPDLSHRNVNFTCDSAIKDELYLNYGNESNTFPYKEQDLYSVKLVTKTCKTVVLENRFLKAVFLPEFGARLISIYDKKRKKDIVFNNKDLRIANIALRNAWFAGGVEFNSGLRGHSPFTCDNVFCEIIDSNTVRFYEWERIRKQFFEIIAFLPNNSRQLFLKMKLINCNNHETPAYWWSNIAIKENYGTRVITNCEKAYSNDYTGNVSKVPVPYRCRTDITYPVRNPSAIDYFFDTFDDKQRFIMAAEENGDAFFQTSTSMLKGRKEFVWGMGQGGFNWQRKLCGNTDSYFEIQAGLARTQMECLPMPANAVWEWTESYGMTKVDVEKIFSTDWNVARKEGALRVEKEVNEPKLDRITALINERCKKQGKLVHTGSAWATLEKKLNYSPVYDSFAEVPLKSEQKCWLELTENNTFIEPENPNDNPAGYIYDEKLKQFLENCAGNNWYAYFHLGIMYFFEKDTVKAKVAFEKSASLKESPWAFYGLAEIFAAEEDYKSAVTFIKNALKIRPNDIRLLRKLSEFSLKGNISDEYIQIYEKLPSNIKSDSRLKLLSAMAYIETENLDKFENILKVPFETYDIREGDTSFNDTWEKYLNLKYFKEDMSEEEKETVREIHPIPLWLNYTMQ